MQRSWGRHLTSRVKHRFAPPYHLGMYAARSQDKLQESLRQVQDLLERHRVLEELTHKQATQKRDLLESLVHRQNLAEIHNRVRSLHPADLAFILEALPREHRLLVWTQLAPARGAQVLVEVSPTVRQSLMEGMERPALLETLRAMDPEDLAYVADDVGEDVRREVYAGLDADSMSWLRGSQAWPEGSVGHLMTQELVALRDGGTLDDALEEVRGRQALPPQTDALCVVDGRNVLKGVLPVEALLVRPGHTAVSDTLKPDAVTFAPADDAGQAAKAFERYDLVSAPVIDERGKLVGRLTVDAVMDFVRRRAEVEALRRAGLAGEEDLFAPAGASARNRWLWLGVNVFTAFTASRVIGLFDETIARTLALATLMPVVASVGGNTGNQTVALMIRGLALDQLTPDVTHHLFRKELAVGLLNGALWGGLMGLATLLLYGAPSLGVVMAAAVVLNLVVAAVAGVAVPLALRRAGRDPAQGASVLLTFITDSMGFLIFLGLARVFLS
jgi:magnesium transporter